MYSTYPMENGLSDRDAQVLELYVDDLSNNKNEHTTITLRKINFNTINEFKEKLSSELWQNVFENDNNDVDSILTLF